jgi:pyrroloquinoline quinone biosynthesis protein D
MALRNRDPPDSTPRPLRLAPGARLLSDGESAAALQLAEGEVRLNQHALAILKLCDGSRSLAQVVTDSILRSAGQMRASDVVEFLAAAQSRGWLIESD